MLFFALKNILSRPTRTTLAVLGMSVAILGMVGLFSIASGLDQVVGNTLNRVPGFLAMQRGAPIPLFSTLPRAWTEELDAMPGISVVSPECWSRANVIEGKVVISPPRLLCGSDIVRRIQLKTTIYREDIIQGRYLNENDIGTFHCVLSKQIAEEHKKTVGDFLEINGQKLKIVGIYYTGSLLLDVAIILDEDRFRDMARFDKQTVSCYYIEQDGTVSNEELLKQIQKHFRGRGPDNWKGGMLVAASIPGKNPISWFVKQMDDAIRQKGPEKSSATQKPIAKSEESKPVEPNRNTKKKESESHVSDDPMEVRLATDWVGRFDKFTEDLDIALALLTSLGLFIAVVSIVNTMLMSVTERVSEFGILRANGWSKWDLIRLITFESLLLGVAGGLIGIVLGWGMTHIINAAFPSKIELYASPMLLLFAFSFSAILGSLAGLYPAIWAARLKPIEAIRRN